MIHPAALVLALVSAAVFGAAFFIFTTRRYKSIAKVSERIDLVLHNADRVYISGEREGELSILESEITKMTLRIREQNAALHREKIFLADSLADIAHQLRTPLTSVNLILSLLEKESDESRRKEFLQEMEELLVRMDGLLTALLKLSRLDAGVVIFQKGQVDVKEMINAALRPFLISMDIHNIALQTDVPEGIKIQGDFDWLSEAVQNIIKNCVESVGDNGQITIMCRDTPFLAEIVIHDSGPGFKKEDLPRLFDRFYRGKNTKDAGFGIGLSLCRTIITGQGGTVSAKNHSEGGAVFCIRFPVEIVVK